MLPLAKTLTPRPPQPPPPKSCADDSGLVDPEGSVSIIAVGAESDAVTAVPFTPIAATDAALKSAGVHLPLEKNAQIYFDDNSAKFKDDLDFTASRAAYTPATQLEPEYVAWSADGTKIYVNLQENSAIVTIDVATATATQIKGMPLKDWSEDGGNEGLDTVKDDGCTLANKVGYKSMRMPDAIAVATIDGQVCTRAAPRLSIPRHLSLLSSPLSAFLPPSAAIHLAPPPLPPARITS